MQKQNPLVSIIIPTYNCAPYIDDAILSALGQKSAKIEVLVIDDGSSDGTDEVIAKYSRQIQYYPITHQGVSAARNFGIEKAKGEYVVFLDADDKLHPEFVKKTLHELQSSDVNVGYVYTQMQYFEASQRITQFPDYNLDYLLVKNFLGTNCIIDAKIARKYPYDTKLAVWEDWDHFLTLAENGIEGRLLNESLYHYRKRSIQSSALDTFQGKQQLYSSHMLAKKHWRLYGVVNTAQHWAWYWYNSFKKISQGKNYSVKEPEA